MRNCFYLMKYEVANEYPGDEWVAYIEVCLHTEVFCKPKTVFCFINEYIFRKSSIEFVIKDL